MNDGIDLTYFAYGNRDFPCLKNDSQLSQASVSVKTSSADILQRNYLNFEPEIIQSYKMKNLRKMIHSKSSVNISGDENFYNFLKQFYLFLIHYYYISCYYYNKFVYIFVTIIILMNSLFLVYLCINID